jgi:dihydropteroate synthase
MPTTASRPVANLAGIAVGGAAPVRLVGVINASPESFFPGSIARGRAALVRMAERHVAAGADILDIGAMSTAPYKNAEIPEEEERKRLVAAVGWLRGAVDVPLSVDTRRARCAAAALDAGAAIVNDVTGLRGDPAMAAVARHAAGLILMAAEERPGGSGRIGMVRGLLRRSLAIAGRNGIAAERIVLDPGVGFFRRCRTPWHAVDVEILRRLGDLDELGRPLLVGVSRKSFLGHLAGRPDVDDRLPGSLAATAVAVVNGAALVRCHDVAATRDAVRVAAALR